MNGEGVVVLKGTFTGCINATAFPFRAQEPIPQSTAATALFNHLKIPTQHRTIPTEQKTGDAEVVAVAAAATRLQTGTTAAIGTAANLQLQVKPPCKGFNTCKKKCMSSKGTLKGWCKLCQIEQLRKYFVDIQKFLEDNKTLGRLCLSWKKVEKCCGRVEAVLQLKAKAKPSNVRKCYVQCIDCVRFLWWEMENNRRKAEAETNATAATVATAAEQ